jgi:NTP pyrophosphatase (non-canonical NTP hydrolase)
VTVRTSSLVGRSLSAVTSALSIVRDAALARALDPRNVAKGDWRAMTWPELRAKLEEETGELVASVEACEPIPRVLSEAGDVVWCVAMIADWYRGHDG